MPICKKCNNEFSNKIIKNGKNKSLRRRSYCLICVPSKRKFTDEQAIETAKKVKCISKFLKELGLRASGGNYIHAKKTIQRLNINTSHWTGKAWNKGQQLKKWDEYRQVASLKPILLKQRGYKCEKCFLTKWLNDVIPLEVHHIDGDRTNNDSKNLQILCCNCHSLTKNWRGRFNVRA